jgi:hypothetical protein
MADSDEIMRNGAGEHGTGGLNLQTAAKLCQHRERRECAGGTGNWNQLKDKCENIEEARAMGAGNGGQLNPQFVEWLMNYPINWTDTTGAPLLAWPIGSTVLNARKFDCPSNRGTDFRTTSV